MAWGYEVQRVLSPLFRLAFGLRVTGGERIPRRGGVLLCANHASYLDPWWIGHALTSRSWRSLITDAWYDRNPALRFVLAACGTIPTARGRPEATVARVVAALRDGDAVIVFPEGGISPDGRIRRGRSGIAWMAAASGAPVVPCGIRGGHAAFPRTARWPRLRPVAIHVGTPLRFPGDGATDRPPSPERADPFVRDLMATIADLADRPSP